MPADYLAKRMLALFHAYETFQPTFALVDHTLRPLIELEVAEYFYQNAWGDMRGIDLFCASLHNRFREAQILRMVTVVEDVSVGYDRSTRSLTVSWQMRGGAIETILIKPERTPTERDNEYAKRLGHLRDAVEFLKTPPKTDEERTLEAFRTLFPGSRSPSEMCPHPGHDVYLLDASNSTRPVHVARYSAQFENFEADCGWYEPHEVTLWAYCPNLRQEEQRKIK